MKEEQENKLKKLLIPSNPWRIIQLVVVAGVAYVAGQISPGNPLTEMAEIYLKTETGITMDLD